MALRIGIVGVGFGATVHIPAFQSEGLEVVAVCSRRSERVQEAAAKFGVPNAFTDYDEMLRLPGLDAVSIATPPSLHKEQALAAIAAGKHVMCEKPFALNASEAREPSEAPVREGPFTGQSFCVTGVLTRRREDVHESIRASGGEVHDAVKKGTTFLVAGEKVGATKLEKAKKFGTRVITEAELYEMLGAGPREGGPI